ncbi:MAG: DUF6270 domain-containing protein [Clostridium sp.]
MNISIHGSTVSRDIFNVGRNYINYNDEITNGFYKQSIFSSVSKPVELDLTDIGAESDYINKCIESDFNKDIFKKLKKDKSEYIIIDLIEERYPLGKINDRYFTNSTSFSRASLANKLTYTSVRKDTINWDEVKSTINEYCSKLEKIYKQDKIVVFELYHAEEYVDINGVIKQYPYNDEIFYNYKNINSLLKKYYEILKERLPNAKIVSLKEIGKATEKHQFGLMGFHYQEKFYLEMYQEFLRATGRAYKYDGSIKGIIEKEVSDIQIEIREKAESFDIEVVSNKNNLTKLYQYDLGKWKEIREYNQANIININNDRGFYRFSTHIKNKESVENMDNYKQFYFYRIINIGGNNKNISGKNIICSNIKNDITVDELFEHTHKKLKALYNDNGKSIIIINLKDKIEKIANSLSFNSEINLLKTNLEVAMKNISFNYNLNEVVFTLDSSSEWSTKLHLEIIDFIKHAFPGVNIYDSNKDIDNDYIIEQFKEKTYFPGEKIFSSNRNIKYVFYPAKDSSDKRLLVGFSGYASKNEALYNFIRQTDNTTCNRLFILDDYGTPGIGIFYLGHKRGLDVEASVMALINYYMSVLEIGVKDVITFGRSKGGTVALYYGLKYSFGKVISGCFQYTLGDCLIRSKSAVAPQTQVLSYIGDGIDKDSINFVNSIIYKLLIEGGNRTKLHLHIVKDDPYNIFNKEFFKVAEEKGIKYELDLVEGNVHWSPELFKEYVRFFNKAIEK